MTYSKNVYEAELELARGVRKIDEQTWEADNCASALAWLRCYLYWPTGVAAKMQRDGGVEIRMQQRVFFRGHANAHWKPTPRLLRFEGEALHRATVAGKLAASIVNVEFEMLWSADGTQNWPPLVENTGYAAIQHYCIPTSLLDWTTIPSVAVHFATCSEDSKNSPMAAVLWLDVANAAELGLKIILPPVYVSRLYRQRGLFTELTIDMVKEVDKRCRKIMFPAQPCCPALLTTDGRHTIEADLLPNEAWFENLKEWTWDKAVDEYIANADPVNANMAFTSQHGHHPALRDYSEVVAMFQGDEHLGPIMAYIFELAGRATRDGECYDPRVMKLLERNNAAFFQWLRQEGEKFLPCY